MYKSSPFRYEGTPETRTIGTALSNADLGDVTAQNSASTFTFASGTPSVSLNVGDRITFTNLSEAGNNTTYEVIGFSGTSDRVVEVSPAPTDMTTDAAWDLAIGSMAFTQAADCYAARIALDGAADGVAFYKTGQSPAAASNEGVMLTAGAYEYIALQPGERLAVAGAGGTFNFAPVGK